MRRVRILQAVLILVVAVSGVMLYELLRAGYWWQGIFLLLPDLGSVLAVVELQHSGEANELRDQLNRLTETHNVLVKERNELQRQLNDKLAEIARVIRPSPTPAERNASKLRKYVGATVAVRNSDGAGWGFQPQIAEVSGDNIVALFRPKGHGNQASVIHVSGDQLEIIEIPQGECPLQLKVNRTYGDAVALGEITKWEERRSAAATPRFDKGEPAVIARFRKPGSTEARTLFIFGSKDGSNSFLLEASTGERFVENNKVVSIRFLSLQVEYLAEGFQRAGASTGAATHALFIS